MPPVSPLDVAAAGNMFAVFSVRGIFRLNYHFTDLIDELWLSVQSCG